MASKLFLEKAYLAYFGRPVDPTGLVAFANSTEAEVAAAFSASPESKALFGPTFGAAQINLIYQTLFGRDAEPAGIKYWLYEVERGALTPTGAALGILDGARNSDITAAANKLAASAAFTASLDTVVEIQGYAGNDAAAVARDFLKSITATPATEAQVAATVANSTGIFTITAAADAVQEGGDVVFKLTLDSAPAKAITVNYSTATGTASSADFASAAGQVTFAVGQTVAFVTIKTVDDAIVESAESFTLNVSGSNLASAVTATATINDQTDIDAAAAARTFTLTTDSETILGTAGDNLITGTEKTLAFDEIDGAAGVDTLRLVIGTDGMNGSLGETVKNVEQVVIQTLGNISTDISGYTGVENVNVTAVNGADIDLTSAAAQSVTIKASQGEVDLIDKTAKTIDVTTGLDATVTAGDATSIVIDAGTSATVTAKSVDTAVIAADINATLTIAAQLGAAMVTAGRVATVTAGDATSIVIDAGTSATVTANSVDTAVITAATSADLTVAALLGSATVTSGKGEVLVSAGSAGSIDASSGFDDSDGITGYSASVNVAGNVDQVNVDAGGFASVVVGSADAITVKSGYYTEVIDGETVVLNSFDAEVKSAGNIGSIDMNAGLNGLVEVGVFGQESVYTNDVVTSAGTATTVGNVGAISLTAAGTADVYVTGDVGSLAVNAGDDVDIEIGVVGEQAYSKVNGESIYSEEGLATTVSSVDTIDVTTAEYADIRVTGNAGTVTVDAAKGADIEVGVRGDGAYFQTNSGSSDEYQGLAAVASTVEAINVTSTGEYSYGVDVEVLGNVGSIAIVSSDDVDIYVGDEGSGASSSDNGQGYAYQYAGQAAVASTVQTIDVVSADDTYIDVVGSVGTIKVVSGDDVDIEVGSYGEQAYKNANEEDAGQATVASTVASIDVTSADNTYIDVVGSVGTIKVDSGDGVNIDIGVNATSASQVDEETGFGYQGLAGAVSNVGSIDVTAADYVSIGVTGNIGQASIAAAAGESLYYVDVNAGGSIDSLSISGVNGGDSTYIQAASIGALSLTDVNQAEVSDNLVTDVADAALVRNANSPENVYVELTNAAATSLDLTVAGVIANLNVSNSATVPAPTELAPEATAEVNLETLNLTVNEYALAYTETVVAVDEDEVETTTEVEHSFIVESAINLNSNEVKTLNIGGTANLTLGVASASVLALIDAQGATGNITVSLDNTASEGNVLTSYLGGEGVDTVTLAGGLPTLDIDDNSTFSLNGGAGSADKLLMTGALAQTAIDGQDISGFEILQLSNVGGYGPYVTAVDATRFGTSHVILDGAGGSDGQGSYALNLTIANAGKVELTGSTVGNGLVVGVAGAAAAGAAAANFSLNLVLGAQDSEGVSVNAAVAKVGTIAVESNGTDSNSLALNAAETTTLNITGNAALDLESSTLTAVKTVNAADFDAGLYLDLSAHVVAATVTVGDGSNYIATGSGADTITLGNGFNEILSGAGKDIITVGNGSTSTAFAAGFDAEGVAVTALNKIIAIGNVIEGGAGKDTITLGAGAVDTLVYNFVIDSNGVNVDVVNGFQASFLAGQIERDVVVDLVVTGTELVNVMANDIIDLSGITTFGSGFARSYAGEADGYGAVLTSLTKDLVTAVLDSTTSIVYVDVDGSGTLDSNDLSIKLVGVTDLEAANFDFGQWATA